MTNSETQIPPSPLEVYYKLHYDAKKKEWPNHQSKAEYENIVAQKTAAMDKLASEGTDITTDMERKLEKEAIKSVCEKKKTIQSGWEAGVEPVLMKKDLWMKTRGQSSQGQADTKETNEALKKQIKELKEKIKENNETHNKMSEFLLAKFLNFKSIISKPVSDDPQSLDEVSGSSYSTT